MAAFSPPFLPPSPTLPNKTLHLQPHNSLQSLFIHQLNMGSEVVVAMSPGRDFHFDSTPVSAPSSPKSFGYFYDHSSAPTSPTRAAAVYSQFNLDIADFNFSFATEAETGPAVPADELFEGGRIRPLRSSGERGRQEASSASSRSHRPSRSLSPMRGGEVYEIETSTSSKPPSTSSSTADIKSGGSRRWRITDLLLFRSASEGRATGRESRDPLSKYCPLAPSTSSSTRKGKGGLAEIHYRENRAAYEEQKKKTALPYHRNGLFGYLKFNPAINSITRGINSRVRS